MPIFRNSATARRREIARTDKRYLVSILAHLLCAIDIHGSRFHSMTEAPGVLTSGPAFQSS
ncbi:hypothetical protein EX30DRAFT_344710 [Ascodesmis nigricans]|uniref:Uncharacterized protein n=1 Tax=Ascodesmis nigricans TaxID=341454 RepID=A0A4S2MIH6_9PEZI|nr:hypothetical protein EX30DRAFT_344710 [Ascodesmis nigricans]